MSSSIHKMIDEFPIAFYNSHKLLTKGTLMISQLRIFESIGFDPYTNLATEKHLMDMTEPGTCLLYLWQNQNTVVIGKNQNAWQECRTTLLQQEGGTLARRLSGGGAVFHDLGNLNFTFIMCKEDYDLDKQISVIQTACNLAGIAAVKSGRNDLLADGRKFSGNAFYQNRTHAYHHGTLMVDVDREKLGRYLSPPKAKLEAKGVASVRSRVVNLKELAPHLTIASMKQYMLSAFEKVYGLTPKPLALSTEDQHVIENLRSKYAAWEYVYGAPLPFTFQCESYFPWGHIQLQLNVREGFITEAKVYSDSMDWALPEKLASVLTGCAFETTAIQRAIKNTAFEETVCANLCQMFSEQSL